MRSKTRKTILSRNKFSNQTEMELKVEIGEKRI